MFRRNSISFLLKSALRYNGISSCKWHTVFKVSGFVSSRWPTLVRPFSLCTRVSVRLQNADHFPVGRESYGARELLTFSKNPKAKKKHNKLKTKLSERLEADQLEAKIQATVDLVRKRLKLDETFIAAINMNIDYLISEKIPVEIISKIGEKSPKTLQLDLNIIKKRIRVLKINSLYEDSIKKCLQRNPSLLMSRLEDTLSQKVEAFRGLQLSLSVSEIAGVLERCPDIIEYLTLEKLVDKVEFLLKKLNFSNKQVRRMLIKHPAILTMGKDSLKEKTNFLFASFNANHDLISKYPRALQCPIKRLRERYLFLKQEELAGNEIKVRGWALKTLAVNSDAYFAGNIAKKPLKRFRDFQDQLSRE